MKVYGAGRKYVPWALAAQAQGYANTDPDEHMAVPIRSIRDRPATIGAGIFGNPRLPWRGNGIFAVDYAMPDYLAEEPNEGWWLSAAKNFDTGERVWMTNLSGLGTAAVIPPSRRYRNRGLRFWKEYMPAGWKEYLRRYARLNNPLGPPLAGLGAVDTTVAVGASVVGLAAALALIVYLSGRRRPKGKRRNGRRGRRRRRRA